MYYIPTQMCFAPQVDGNLADLQYLWIDLVTILPIAIFMGRTGPHGRLEPQQPEASLISKSVIGSIGGQVAGRLRCAATSACAGSGLTPATSCTGLGASRPCAHALLARLAVWRDTLGVACTVGYHPASHAMLGGWDTMPRGIRCPRHAECDCGVGCADRDLVALPSVHTPAA